MRLTIKIAAALLLLFFQLPAAAVQYVILKADDFQPTWPITASSVNAGWDRYFQILEARGLKSSFGIYKAGAEDPDTLAGFSSKMQQVAANQNYEIFNHGEYHITNEFVGPSSDEQLASLQATQTFAAGYNITLRAFGSPGNAADANTAIAISQVPELKVWFFPPNTVTPPAGVLGLGRYKEIEWKVDGVRSPDAQRFIQEGWNDTREVYTFQLHPGNYYVDPNTGASQAFDELEATLDYIQSKNVEFVTPYQYYQIVNGQQTSDVNILWEDDFNDGGLQNLKCHDACPTPENGYLRFTLTHASDDKNHRTEIVLQNQLGDLLLERKKDYWIGFRFNRTNWPKDTTSNEASFQMYVTPSDWGTTSYNTNLKCSGSPPAWAYNPYFLTTSGDNTKHVLYQNNFTHSGAMLRNQWVDVVIHVRLADGKTGTTVANDGTTVVYDGEDGLMETWVNGVKAPVFIGATVPSHDNCGKTRDIFLKFGIYKWDWKYETTGSSVREILYDDITVAEGLNGFDAVNPGAPVQADITPPVFSNVAINANTTTAVVTWKTNEPATTKMRLDGVVYSDDQTLTTDHTVTITGLTESTAYTYNAISYDAAGNVSDTGTTHFTTATAASQNLSSDFFDSASLDTTKWTVVDPAGGSVVTQSSGKVSLQVPAGSSRDIWKANMDGVRIMQSAVNTDFTVEIKNDAPMGINAQLVGIIAQEDVDNVITARIYHTGSGYFFHAVAIRAGLDHTKANVSLGTSLAPFIKVVRTGDVWDMSYSFDGQSWITGATFTENIVISDVGVFAGSVNDNPGYTALIDYFRVNDDPIPNSDVTAPVISNVAVTQTDTTATITWDTDEAADSKINYGTTVSYGPTVSDAALVTSHSVTLTGLTPQTLYHYQVVSKDASLNSASTTDATFTTTATPDTTAPTITNVIASSITETSAVITWSTSEIADSRVEYGITDFAQNVSDATMVSAHSVTLTGLTASTHYQFLVKSSDAASNESVRIGFTFTTADPPDAVAPVISQVQSSTTESAATIIWETDEPATSVVDYGLTTAYGQTATLTDLELSHSVSITGLTADTEYHYRVTSVDANGNSAVGSDATFITAAAASNYAPVIRDFKIEVGRDSVTMMWYTDKPSTTHADIGQSSYTNSALKLKHAVTFNNLTPGTRYNYYVRAVDQNGNIKTEPSNTFATGKFEVPQLYKREIYKGEKTADGPVILATGESIYDGVDDAINYGNVNIAGKQMTLVTRIKPDSIQHCADKQCSIIDKSAGTAEAQQYVMLTTHVDSRGYHHIIFKLKIAGETHALISRAVPSYINTSTDIAATYDGEKMKIYINGEPQGYKNVTGLIETSDDDFYIGGSKHDKNHQFDGSVDLSRTEIVNRALSAMEIQAKLP